MKDYKPPYYAVIFTATQTAKMDGYSEMSKKLYGLASTQPGFLGIESVDGEYEITISYWTDLDSISK